jgi:hypothetical protein
MANMVSMAILESIAICVAYAMNGAASPMVAGDYGGAQTFRATGMVKLL